MQIDPQIRQEIKKYIEENDVLQKYDEKGRKLVPRINRITPFYNTQTGKTNCFEIIIDLFPNDGFWIGYVGVEIIYNLEVEEICHKIYNTHYGTLNLKRQLLYDFLEDKPKPNTRNNNSFAILMLTLMVCIFLPWWIEVLLLGFVPIIHFKGRVLRFLEPFAGKY